MDRKEASIRAEEIAEARRETEEALRRIREEQRREANTEKQKELPFQFESGFYKCTFLVSVPDYKPFVEEAQVWVRIENDGRVTLEATQTMEITLKYECDRDGKNGSGTWEQYIDSDYGETTKYTGTIQLLTATRLE